MTFALAATVPAIAAGATAAPLTRYEPEYYSDGTTASAVDDRTVQVRKLGTWSMTGGAMALFVGTSQLLGPLGSTGKALALLGTAALGAGLGQKAVQAWEFQAARRH